MLAVLCIAGIIETRLGVAKGGRFRLKTEGIREGPREFKLSAVLLNAATRSSAL